MKKVFLVLICVIMVFVITSCQKDKDGNVQTEIANDNEEGLYSTWPSNSEEVDAFLAMYYEKHKLDRMEFRDRWKWIKVRVGTHLFNNCTGNNPCGPCPGICIKLNAEDAEVFNMVNEDYCLTRSEYDDGERLMQGALLDDTTLALTFIHSDFTINDILYIPEEFKIGNSASGAFMRRTITILEGEYPISYTHGMNGTTLVRVKIE